MTLSYTYKVRFIAVNVNIQFWKFYIGEDEISVRNRKLLSFWILCGDPSIISILPGAESFIIYVHCIRTAGYIVSNTLFYTVVLSWQPAAREPVPSYLARVLFVLRKKRNASPYLALKFSPVEHPMRDTKETDVTSQKSNIEKVNSVTA